VPRHFALNLIRLAPVQRKGGLKVKRLIASTSDTYRAQLLGLAWDSCDGPVETLASPTNCRSPLCCAPVSCPALTLPRQCVQREAFYQ